MTSNYTIRSKISVKPKKSRHLLNILLNLCLIIVMIAGIFKILFDGLDLRTIGTMALAIVIVSMYKKRPANNEHYEFALVEMTVSDEEIILIYKQMKAYKNYDLKFTIPKSTISILEYSDRLLCIRICGEIKGELLDGKGIVNEFSEHYLYLEKDSEVNVLRSIQEKVGISIKYMDR